MLPTLKVAIVLDNTFNNDLLRHHLTIMNPEIEVCGDANNISQAVGLIEKYKPDFIFLDIYLKDGLGFQVVDFISQKGIPLGELIFVSATQDSEYALKAIEYACLDFIQKPITENAVLRTIEKVKESYLQKWLNEYAHNQSPKVETNIIAPTEQNKKEVIDIDKISYCKAQNQNTIIHFADGSYVTAFRILNYFKKQLTDYPHFFQIHHGLLVNASNIKSFNPKSYEVTMTNGAILEASRRYGMKFKAFWNELSKHHFFL